MKQKKGQFFLLAGIILISIIAGIFLYSNQVFIQDSGGGVYSLKDEIDLETSIVIDYGLYVGQSYLQDFISNMTSNLFTRVGADLDLIFFYSNKTHLHILNLGENNITFKPASGDERNISTAKLNATSQISVGGVTLGGIPLQQYVDTGLIQTIPINEVGSSATFQTREITYTLDLLSDKHFYFVVKKQIGDELYVETNQ